MALDINSIADRLIEAYDSAGMLAPISASVAEFDIAEGYRVLAEIDRRRRAQGWEPLGHKIGFANTTISWRCSVAPPLWAQLWSRTLHFAKNGKSSLDLRSFVQPC